MRNSRGYIGLGVLLIVLGVLFLLQNFGILGGLENLVWVMLFGLGGLAFLRVFVTNNEHWWAIIPGFTLLGLAALIGLGDRLGALGGVLFLGAIGLSFWVIYILKRDFWWAVIPGGTLFTLALVAGLSEALPGVEVGGVFFLGLAATFGLLYFVPTPGGRLSWALIPAGVLGIMGVLLVAAAGNLIGWIWPAALILSGGYLVFRTLLHAR
ncbi:MAG: hypothetical protein CVU38_03765 [Chloroflexi bacterium HGW-Chloroflexi-1]|nr:MAG: hypothetical protein CVU38_03765 [Chloroflexi bacterium HGW-Chloroflexi-1]